MAWPQVERRDYVHGWHVDAICDHLEAVGRGEITRLIVNIPPRHMKSLLTSVFFPCWQWARSPETQFLFSSYSATLAIRDNTRARRLLASPWYKERFPAVELEGDQNQKVRYDTTAGGYRIATSVGGSLTGDGGDIIVLDDPISADEARSEVKREACLTWFDETMRSRLNDPRRGAFVVIMQRLHERDLTGHLLASDSGWDHLCLPAYYEPDHPTPVRSSIGFEDPRTEPGEVLNPDRFGAEELVRLAPEGSYAEAGQLQQRPVPRGGGMFPVERFQIVTLSPAPSEIRASVRFWDKAGSHGRGAYTAGVLMHRLRDGRYVVSDVVRGQWSALDREKRIKQTAEADGPKVSIWVEQEPGSGGKESAEATIRSLAGFTVKADRVSGAGSKETRADPYAAQVQGENVSLVRGNWNAAFIAEHETFPAGQFKDQVDAAAGAFNKLAAARHTGTPMPVAI